jgi:hypothetical protein
MMRAVPKVHGMTREQYVARNWANYVNCEGWSDRTDGEAQDMASRIFDIRYIDQDPWLSRASKLSRLSRVLATNQAHARRYVEEFSKPLGVHITADGVQIFGNEGGGSVWGSRRLDGPTGLLALHCLLFPLERGHGPVFAGPCDQCDGPCADKYPCSGEDCLMCDGTGDLGCSICAVDGVATGLLYQPLGRLFMGEVFRLSDVGSKLEYLLAGAIGFELDVSDQERARGEELLQFEISEITAETTVREWEAVNHARARQLRPELGVLRDWLEARGIQHCSEKGYLDVPVDLLLEGVAASGARPLCAAYGPLISWVEHQLTGVPTGWEEQLLVLD